MTQETKCSHCGTPLSIGGRGNLCPKCLLKRGLEPNTAGFTADGPEASPRWTPPKPEELAPRFPELEILELIGRGGMGAVYKARQKNLDRLVALKILPPEIGRDPAFAERFAREAQAMARLSHPHIVAIHDFGQRDGLFFFLMEYMDGLNLGQLMASGNVSPKEALAIVPQICDALQFAHDQGIVHRDIKPENILLDRRGQVKIADFGLAKLMGQPTAAVTAEKVMGTPQYMAPEQTEHPSEVDHRADIYSLGVVFYQMLTGELPLGKFEPPSHKVLIDVRLDEVVLRALEKEPDRRYQQASQVKTEVETILTTSPRSSAGVPPDREISVAGPPRFSRTAIVGACWAPLFYIGFVMFFIGPVPVGEYHGPEWWPYFLMFTLLPLGFASPFVTTILGCVAISQIRRSAGKLCGLRLALFDALLFPLLALDGVIVFTWLTLARLLESFYANPSNQDNPLVHPDLVTRIANVFAQHAFAVTILVLVTIVMAIVVNFLIIRWAWRAANKPVGGQQPLSSATPGAKRTWLAPALWIVAALVVVPVLLVGITLWCSYEAIHRPAVTREQQALTQKLQNSATKTANATGLLDANTDTPPRWVCRALVDEAEIADVEVGQEVRMVLDAFPGRKFQGKVALVGKAPVKKPNAVLYETTIYIADPDPNFKVGMTVNVTFIEAHREDVLKTRSAAKPATPNSYPKAPSSQGVMATGSLEATTDVPPKWVCRALVEEADIVAVEVGQEVHMTLDAFPGRKFQGKVAQVAKTPVKEPNVVLYETVIDLADPDPRFRVGMSVNVTFIEAHREDVPKTPRPTGTYPAGAP